MLLCLLGRGGLGGGPCLGSDWVAAGLGLAGAGLALAEMDGMGWHGMQPAGWKYVRVGGRVLGVFFALWGGCAHGIGRICMAIVVGRFSCILGLGGDDDWEDCDGMGWGRDFSLSPPSLDDYWVEEVTVCVCMSVCMHAGSDGETEGGRRVCM